MPIPYNATCCCRRQVASVVSDSVQPQCYLNDTKCQSHIVPKYPVIIILASLIILHCTCCLIDHFPHIWNMTLKVKEHILFTILSPSSSWHKVGYQHSHLLFLFSSSQIDVDPMEKFFQFSSVTQSCPTLCDPIELQHTRLPCPSPTPRVYPNSCPLSRWCHPTISFSVIPFSSCLQFFLTLGSFQMSQLFTSGGQNSGVSASTSVLPMNPQDQFPLG